MYFWEITWKGLQISPSKDGNPKDFLTPDEAKAWVREQLAAVLLGNTLHTELEYELNKLVPGRRLVLLEQAKRELLT